VKSIEEGAFSECLNLTQILLPNGISTIPKNALKTVKT